MGINLHVVPYRDGWDVIYEDSRYAESHHATQQEAIAAASALAQREHAALLIHDKNGTLQK